MKKFLFFFVCLYSYTFYVQAETLPYGIENNYNLTLMGNTQNVTPLLFYGFINNSLENNKLTFNLNFDFNPSNNPYNWNVQNDLLIIVKPFISYNAANHNGSYKLTVGFHNSVTAEENVKDFSYNYPLYFYGRGIASTFHSDINGEYPITSSTYVNNNNAASLSFLYTTSAENFKLGLTYTPDLEKELYIPNYLQDYHNNDSYVTYNSKEALFTNLGFYGEYKTVGYTLNLGAKNSFSNFLGNLDHNYTYTLNLNLAYFGFNLDLGALQMNNHDNYTNYNLNTTSYAAGLSYSFASLMLGGYYLQSYNRISNDDFYELHLRYQLNSRVFLRTTYVKQKILDYNDDAIFIGFTLNN